MKLSIIIVSYNALDFLNLCLKSVKEAIEHIEAEVILVDNNSSESISQYVKSEFPFVKLIENDSNLGFGKANNLGLNHANGNLVLYLNPDTIICEENLKASISEFERDSQLGALGFRMINGKGNYLPESKRSVPSLWSSISRFLGLSQLFPTSKFFSNYRLGHLDERGVHEVEVLSGAAMMVRADKKEDIKFDSAFFMYGEDIDLSYRIGKSGRRVKYLGSETLIHFKGESTNKKAWKYHYWFYETMWMFRKKHKSDFNSIWNPILRIGIWKLMLFSFLKAQISGTGKKTFDSEVKGINIIGAKEKNLCDYLNQNFTSLDLNDSPESELQVFNFEVQKPELLIESLENLSPDQSLMIWNNSKLIVL